MRECGRRLGRQCSAPRRVHEGGSGVPLAGDLIVKAAERDAERLQCAKRSLIVHSEGILANTPKLHENRLWVFGGIVELEVLHRSARDPTVEI
eukprot:scaffold122056_cov27-Tisochrysis_lutea.AAC.3